MSSSTMRVPYTVSGNLPSSGPYSHAYRRLLTGSTVVSGGTKSVGHISNLHEANFNLKCL